MSSILSFEKKYETAIEYLDKMLALRANDDKVISEKGWIRYLEGNMDSALDFLKQSLEINSQSGLHHYRMGKVLWKIGTGVWICLEFVRRLL